MTTNNLDYKPYLIDTLYPLCKKVIAYTNSIITQDFFQTKTLREAVVDLRKKTMQVKRIEAVNLIKEVGVGVCGEHAIIGMDFLTHFIKSSPEYASLNIELAQIANKLPDTEFPDQTIIILNRDPKRKLSEIHLDPNIVIIYPWRKEYFRATEIVRKKIDVTFYTLTTVGTDEVPFNPAKHTFHILNTLNNFYTGNDTPVVGIFACSIVDDEECFQFTKKTIFQQPEEPSMITSRFSIRDILLLDPKVYSKEDHDYELIAHKALATKIETELQSDCSYLAKDYEDLGQLSARINDRLIVFLNAHVYITEKLIAYKIIINIAEKIKRFDFTKLIFEKLQQDIVSSDTRIKYVALNALSALKKVMVVDKSLLTVADTNLNREIRDKELEVTNLTSQGLKIKALNSKLNDIDSKMPADHKTKVKETSVSTFKLVDLEKVNPSDALVEEHTPRHSNYLAKTRNILAELKKTGLSADVLVKEYSSDPAKFNKIFTDLLKMNIYNTDRKIVYKIMGLIFNSVNPQVKDLFLKKIEEDMNAQGIYRSAIKAFCNVRSHLAFADRERLLKLSNTVLEQATAENEKRKTQLVKDIETLGKFKTSVIGDEKQSKSGVVVLNVHSSVNKPAHLVPVDRPTGDPKQVRRVTL